MNFTVTQLEEKLSDWEDEAKLEQNLFLSMWYEEVEVLPYIEGIGQIEFAERSGGEGDGAEISIVIKIGNRYFQRDGYYSSWGEDSMDGDIYEVKPKQVQRTEYDRI